jgi:hypothetical protein
MEYERRTPSSSLLLKKHQSGSFKSMVGDDSVAYEKSGIGKPITIRHVEKIIGCESKKELSTDSILSKDSVWLEVSREE